MVDVLRFELDAQRYGLFASDVLEIIRAASPAKLPVAPPVILGVLNVGSDVVPVYDIRSRFGASARALAASDTMILARAGERTVAIAVDRALDVIAVDGAALRVAPAAAPHHVRGLAALDDGTLVIVELSSFLSDGEAMALDRALDEAG
jgi:purine-binding chemotaxis protein CheW